MINITLKIIEWTIILVIHYLTSVGFVITIVCKVSGNFREVDVSLKDTVFDYITYKSSLIQNNL